MQKFGHSERSEEPAVCLQFPGLGPSPESKQYNNDAKNADQKLWCAWNQDNHRKKPTSMSINALKQMESTENKLRIQCPDENAKNSKDDGDHLTDQDRTDAGRFLP